MGGAGGKGGASCRVLPKVCDQGCTQGGHQLGVMPEDTDAEGRNRGNS